MLASSTQKFAQVQDLLGRNGSTAGKRVRNRFGALLKGILRCKACDAAMTPSHTCRSQHKRYRYYTCTRAQKAGWSSCPAPSVAAAPIERIVVDQIRAIGRDPTVLKQTLAEVRRQHEARLTELDAECRGLERDLGRWRAELAKLGPGANVGEPNGRTGPVSDVQERIRLGETQLLRVREQIEVNRQQTIDETAICDALARFMPVWDELAPAEQARVVELLVERVDYDGAAGRVAITFHQTGLQALTERKIERRKEKIA
jgi:site-specific DNA recombinase